MIKKLSSFLNDNLDKVFFIALLIQALLVLVLNITRFNTYDLSVWFNAINGVKDGVIPYLTTPEFILGPSEYPVLFTYFLLPLTLFHYDFTVFAIAFGFVQVIFSGLIIKYLSLILELDKRDKSLALVMVLCPIFFALCLLRFDLMPVALLLMSYYHSRVKNHAKAGVLLALASTLKIFPAVFLLGFYFIKGLNFKKFLLSFFLTVFILYIPVLILNPNTLFYPLSYASSDFRPENIFYLLSFMGLDAPMIATQLYKYSLIALLLGLTAFFVRKPLGIGALLTIAVLLTSPLFSPQWSVWLTPIMLLLGVNPIILILFEVITFIEFPFIWNWTLNLTMFSPARFSEGGLISALFVLLNFLRYAFHYYFIIWIIKNELLRRRVRVS